ncbi:MAG: hypothetical protein AAF702_22895 [Chloroflexota bacterium]
MQDETEQFSVLGRLGDARSEKRFGVSIASLEIIQENFPYRIIWETPPGDALQDNGNIEMYLGGFNWIECSAYRVPWGIQLIPGRDEMIKPYEYCFTPKQLYMPIVNWFGSFFEEEE